MKLMSAGETRGERENLACWGGKETRRERERTFGLQINLCVLFVLPIVRCAQRTVRSVKAQWRA